MNAKRSVPRLVADLGKETEGKSLMIDVPEQTQKLYIEIGVSFMRVEDCSKFHVIRIQACSLAFHLAITTTAQAIVLSPSCSPPRNQ